MIEFKRAGDLMVFECTAFKIEVLADSERIAISEEASNDHRAKEVVIDAFEILDIMVEHKTRHAHVLKADFDIRDARKCFREFMKKEGL